MPSVLELSKSDVYGPFPNLRSTRLPETASILLKSTTVDLSAKSDDKSTTTSTEMSATRSNSRNLVSLFREAALAHPTTVAVDDAGGSLKLTYRELDVLSSRLAYHIAAALDDIATDDTSSLQGGQVVIPILTSLAASAIVGILAILKTGAAYVPVDCSQWSQEHIATVLEAIGGSVLVYSDDYFSQTPMIEPVYRCKIPISRCGLEVPFSLKDKNNILHTLPPHVGPREDLSFPSNTVQSALACVIFTSGTTGKPKGVMVLHDSMANYAISAKPHIDPTPGARSFLGLSISFDACNGYLFTYLVHGCTAVLADWTSSSFQERFATCSFAVLTPSVLGSLPKPGPEPAKLYPNLKSLVLGGETPAQDLLSVWQPPDANWVIHNVYGPTEATVGVLVGPFEREEVSGRWETGLLGRPLPGTCVKLRDWVTGKEIVSDPGSKDGEQEEGEILIGGMCLAQGYCRDTERMVDRFIDWKGERFYRTGDNGRWHIGEGSNRRIVFLGRKDRTVKNRGFLVNLETEVDAAVLGTDLGSDFGLLGAFTVMITIEDRHIMCTLVSPEGVDVQGLRARIAERLPAYQVPDHILDTQELPIGRTGKVDPRAVQTLFQSLFSLKAVAGASSPGSPFLHGGSESEMIVSSISETLGLPRQALSPRGKKSFMGLGGHSLAAVALSGRLRQRLGASIQPKDILLSKTIDELVAIVLQAGHQGPKDVRTLQNPTKIRVLGADEEQATMTRAQLEFLYTSENAPGASVMHLHFSFPTDIVPSLRKAWKAVLGSESIFQTQFDLRQNLQVVGPEKASFRWEETTLSDEDEGDLDVIIQREESAPRHIGTSFRVFHSSTGGKSRLIWTIHHTLMDGYAACLLLRKVGTVLSRNPSSEIAIPRGPSFCRVLNDIRRSQKSCPGTSAVARSFRHQQQAEIPKPVGKLELFPRPRNSDTKVLENRSVRCELGFSVDQLEEVAHRFNVTPVTLFYVAWAILLARYTTSSNVIFGVVLSGREVAVQDVESVVGPLISTQQLRVLVVSDMSIDALARKVFTDLHSSMEYQWIFEGVGDNETAESEDRSTHTAVVSQRGFPEHPFQEELQDVVAITTVPVSLLIQEDWSFKINYRTDQYGHANVTRLAASFNDILCSMTINEAQRVGSFLQAALTLSQERLLLEFGNAFSSDSMIDGAATKTIMDLFEKAVRDNGDLVAVEKYGRQMTYRELDWATTKVERHITQHGVDPGQVVALHVTGGARSINWIIGIFAIIKEGAVYCPLDDDLPAEMRRDRFERTEAALFLTCVQAEFDSVPVQGAACLAVEDVLLEESELDGRHPVPLCDRDPCALAYICFTSGSTGKPKGITIEHRSVVAMQKHLASRLHAAPGVRIMQFLAVGFDGSMLEIFSAICNGATLVLRPEAEQDLFSVLRSVDVAILTPSAVEGLDPEDFPKPDILYFGGEPLPQSTLDSWALGRKLCNYYGPTEVTMGSVLKTNCSASSPVTIGRPLPSVRAYILNDKQQIVPQGAVGEIVLAGVQVARGYIGMPEETAAKFLPDTISGRLGERMYRTGDMGYWDEDGQLVCLDRRDRLVKVLGFRVSLGNVEGVLCGLPDVRSAAAAVSVDHGNVKGGSLLAWVTPSTVNIGTARQQLASRLPAYSRPQYVFALDSFPRSKNGKLDYTALLQRHDQVQKTNPTHDRTQTELSVAKVWRSLLDLDNGTLISPSDSFISLGGHSIRQLSLASRLATTFGFPVPVRQVLRCDTLGELARAVDSLREAQEPQTTRRTEVDARVRQLGREVLSSAEYEWWLKYQAASPAAAASFSVVWSCSLANKVDTEKLSCAWSDVIARHEILSSRFLSDADVRPYRVFWSTPPRPRIVLDGDLDAVEDANKAFDLSAEYLIRVKLSPSRLLVVISHILCDLTTLRILLREVSSRYGELVAGPVLPLPKSLSYMETAFWFSRPRPETVEFWSRYLDGAPTPVPDLASTGDFLGTSQAFSFPREVFATMMEFSTRYSATLYQTPLMGTAVTLQALTQRSDIILGTPFINRPSELESEATGRGDFDDIGCDYCEKMRVSHLLDQTKTSLQDILSHAIPWHQLLSHLGLELPKDGASYPIFDTVVSLHDYSVMAPLVLDIDGAGPADQPTYTAGSKFKIMFEYTVGKDSTLSLRVEYRTPRVSDETVATMYKGLLGCFGSLLGPGAGHDGSKASGCSGNTVAALRNAVLGVTGKVKIPV